ncbi:MAG: SDR family oxidoreductase [Chloroflexi bacterium]|nr:MAG: SDR family oxidoreductase [Chloroflexota bacterium]
MADLVAGGAGFIGSHLCQRLIDEGRTVICVDNFLTGRRANVKHLLSSPRFELLDMDLIEGVPDIDVERIYHLASPASPPGYARLPIDTMRVNSEGTRHLLELAVKTGSRFLYASTSEVYGDPLEHPQRESYRGNVSSTGPRSMYDEAKRFGEAMTIVYCHSHSVDVRIARIFNTYGPQSDPNDGRLVPNFVVQALTGRPITVYGDGKQTRSLCFVSDLVDGLVRLMQSEAAAGEVVNLGNPAERTVLEYAEIIRWSAGSNSEIVFGAYAVGDDPQRRCPDVTKARDLLGWEPVVSLQHGLLQTIEYFRSEIALQECAV